MPFFRVTNYFVSTFYTEAPSATEALSEVESGELDADESTDEYVVSEIEPEDDEDTDEEGEQDEAEDEDEEQPEAA
ncbi:MAG: hypothetical protein EBR82_72925 [Caulobacteraceae bacterium]|nr:hypothetical protein [Caulobacteraceae bacterium]